MKKLLLTLSVVASAYWSSAQVIVAGVSPSSIIANYNFSWAEPGAWGTPDFNIPGTFVQDTLMLVDDGSTGTNAQGHPIAQEGCNPLVNSLAGKIAVIYRNTCEFGKKAYNAQIAGAVGVIIINRDADVIPMGGGNDGPNVTIPVVMLGNAEGALLVEAMQTGSVVVFMGNKTGLFANDIGLSRNAALIPKLGAIPSLLAQSGTEFNFDLGARVYNPGSNAQTNVSINAKIVDPSSNVVYNNTVSNLSIASTDSVDVDPTQALNFPQFSLSTYPVGRYTLTYTVKLNSIIGYGTTLTNEGQGYMTNTNVATTGGTGTGLTVNVDAEDIGVAQQLTLTQGGTAYTNLVNVATTGGSGTGLTVNIDTLSGVVQSVTINAGGLGYTVGDVVTISGGGEDAQFTIDSVSIGIIDSYTINTIGTGYVVGDVVTISGGSGGTFTIDQINVLNDEYDGDNTISTTFTITDNVYSYGQINPTTNLPKPTLFYRPSENDNTFSICSVINNPNASRVGVAGLYFSATNNTESLAGEEIILYLYTWDNEFTDMNDANFPANDAWTLTEIASGFYNYPSDLQNETVYGQFNNAVALENNRRYLACAQTTNVEVFLGHEGSTNYTWNFDYYAQPLSPGESDGTRFPAGFGADIPNSLAVKMIDVATIGLGENASINGIAYPNPATDAVTISIDGEGVANLTVTDIAGKVVISNAVTLNAGKANVNIASLNAGIYVFNVALENGKTSQFKVTKR